MEKFKELKGYDQPLHVGTKGTILLGKKKLTHYKYGNDRPWVLIPKGGKGKARLVHRLVAEAHIPRTGSDVAYYIDGNPNNVDVNNIDWAPLGRHSVSNSRAKKSFIQYTMDDKPVAEWDSIYRLCKISHWAQPNITAALKGLQSSAYGFKWKYKEPV